MADAQLRDLWSVVPGATRDRDAEAPVAPRAAPPEPAVLVTPPPPAKAARAIFAGDRPDGPDVLGIDETLVHLAELAAHKGAPGPLCIGILGGAGTGKSFALRRLAGRIRDIAAAAGKIQGSGDGGPYFSRIHVQAIDAAALEGEPAPALAARLHAGLRQPYPDLAREIGATARDPHVVFRDAEEKLDEARRRLDVERRAADEAGSRRARLTETVLYEAAGSQVDAYARANRASIESRLDGFGIGGDPIRNYKDLVQVVAGSGGVFSLALRSVWAFKGQLKLIVLAVLLVGAAIGLGLAIDDQASWLGQLRGVAKGGAPVADWVQAHIGLLGTARSAALVLATLAVAANLLRAFAFLRPIVKGARLLENDLDSRRRDLDGLCAHQTKRVDTLEADVDRLTREVAEAERRAGGGSRARHEPSPFETGGAATQAERFFATLAALMADVGGQGKNSPPQRIVLTLDHLDAVPPERARAILDAVHRAAGPGLVTLAGFDPARIDPNGSRRGELERWVQVPLRLETAASPETRDALVRGALGHEERAFAPAKIDAKRSDLDAPIEDEEAAMLAALSALVGRTPRAVKRFANLYRVARLGEERHLGALAFMLALTHGGTESERATVSDALIGDETARFELPPGERRLRAALDAAAAVSGRFTRGEGGEAARRAAAFSLAPSVSV